MDKPRKRGAPTAAAIEDAALDLALERGYANVTVADISTRVGISQRAFFNHFPTKDDALLGRGVPQIDQKAAREFVLSSGPLLSDAMALLTQDQDSVARTRLADRIKVISTSPNLLARQMERISAVEDELIDIVQMRIRHQDPLLPAADASAQATMVAHLLAGVMRFVSTQHDDEGDLEARIIRTKLVLDAVLAAS